MIGKRVSYRTHRLMRAYREGGVKSLISQCAAAFGNDMKAIVHRARVRLRSRSGLVLAETSTGPMYVSLNDPGISRQLLKNGAREQAFVDLIRREVTAGMVGLDIGANLGYFALLEGDLVGRTGRVVAMEPVADNASILAKNVEFRKLGHVQVFQAALAPTEGEAKLFSTTGSNLGSMFEPTDQRLLLERQAERREAKVEIVKTSSIGAVMEGFKLKALDFIRVDIEGYEVTALRDIPKSVNRPGGKLKLFVEVHNRIFDDLESTVIPWVQSLLDDGFQPKAVITGDRLTEGISSAELLDMLRKNRRLCPHIFLERSSAA